MDRSRPNPASLTPTDQARLAITSRHARPTTDQSAVLSPRRMWSGWVAEAFAALENGDATPTMPGRTTRTDAALASPHEPVNAAGRGPPIELSAELLRKTHGSAWGKALRIANLRLQRRAAGLDAGVRAIARSLETSAARVSENLQIVDAFELIDVQRIGLAGGADDESWTAIEDRGHARLAALSFRALRSIARLPTFARIARIRAHGQQRA